MTGADDILEGFSTIATANDRLADELDDLLSAGAPPKWLVHRAVATNRLIAAAARPQPSAKGAQQ